MGDDTDTAETWHKSLLYLLKQVQIAWLQQ